MSLNYRSAPDPFILVLVLEFPLDSLTKFSASLRVAPVLKEAAWANGDLLFFAERVILNLCVQIGRLRQHRQIFTE